ncbi:ankyrin repeat domain-containing protein 11-like isoform X2 [Ostrea edulis]|uniref:ankyrin repeat domain-containing protein 11-like isoform X2 n=1 Tax=Ostrea edulis TaxID=37623 RepID=UPI0024AE9ECC|nr:ankyrin repeat domain-containing protein 11-like isoform X2 [Ostrea edulis]
MQTLLQGPSCYHLDISHDKPRMYHQVKDGDGQRDIRGTSRIRERTKETLHCEKPLLIRTPQSESKQLKRKFLVSDSPPQLDEDDRKSTPKRKKPLLNSEMSPTHYGSTPVTKAPSSGITSPRTGPLSERQQMLFLMKMTDDSQDSSSKPTSPQPSVPAIKKTPGDKKVHKRNERGETPLHLAAIKGDVKQTKKLIKAGADVNVADFAGWTPLHEASNRGWVSITKQLLKAGANVNVQGLENDTPLHDASGNGHTELVELLLKHGANPLQPNSNGKTPVDVAASPDMVKLLRKEIVASSSDSSSLDDARSPTSPESNSSCKDDDMDIFVPRNPKSDPNTNNSTSGPSSRKSIFIKFQREQNDEQSDKSPDFYSCRVETSENKDVQSSCDSPASSGSDLYDPQLQSDRFKSKKGSTEDTSATGTESPASKVKLPFSSSSDIGGFELGGFNRLNNLEPDSQNVDHTSQKYKLKVSETQPFFPHSDGFSDSESRDSFKMDSDSDRTCIPSIDSSHSRLKESALDVQRNSVSSVLDSCTSTTQGKSMSGGENNSVSSSSNNEQSFLQNSSNILRRNSISNSNNYVTNSANNANSNDQPNSSVSSSGLKWDLRSTASPKSEEGSNHSGRSESNRTNSPLRVEGKDFKSSPKVDRDNKPCSPKVPPLKIIIPPKTSTASNQDPESAKIHTSKKSLPYVLNPTQEQQAGGLLPQTSTAGMLIPQEIQSVPSPASSRPSSSGSAAMSKDCEKYSGKDSKERDNREVASDAQVNAESDQKSEEISSSKDSNERDSSSKVKDREREGKEKGQEDEKERESQQTRRTLRSHTQALQQEKQKQGRPPPKEKESGSKDSSDKDETGSTTKNKVEDEEVHMLPRKRKGLRPKTDVAAPQSSTEPTISLPTVSYEKPPNPFELYLSIRKQVLRQQNSLVVVHPKAPQGFKDYLMVRCGYVLEGKKASTLSVPMLSPPNSVQGEIRELFINQEKVRYKLRLQHLTEREKLILSLEQERIREHGRAARAMANQNLPLSVCTILRNEEIYHAMDSEQEEKEKSGRARYNGRQFLSWLKDLDDKFEKLKEDLMCRHHMEADSLYAIQKLDWEWKMKELGLCDHNATPEVDEVNVPMVQVHEFDLT